MPTPAPTTSASRIDQGATLAGSGDTAATIFASAMPSAMPIAAPKTLSVADSTRNCDRMSRRFAPSALRMPISRVRSATATSMMFMITIAPTTSPMAGSAVPNRISRPLSSSKNDSAASDVSSAKLSGRAGPRRRKPRIASRTLSMASSSSSRLGACTTSASMSPRGFVTRDSDDLYGPMAMRSSEKPKTLPCFSSTPMTVYGVPPMRISRPTGSSPRKKWLAISVPMMTTGVPSSASCGENSRPFVRLYYLILK